MSDDVRRIGDLATGDSLGVTPLGVMTRGTDTTLELPVLAKVLALGAGSDEPAAVMFRREAKLRARLERIGGPGIAGVKGLELSADAMAQVVDDDRGETTVEAWVPDPAHLAASVAMAAQLAEAVASLHASEGLLVRGLAPGGLLIGGSPQRELRIADLSCSTAVSGDDVLSLPELPLPYMAPELFLSGATGPRSDVYVVASIAFRLLTGRPPHDLSDARSAIATYHLENRPVSITTLVEGLPGAVADTIDRCLEVDPAGRLETVEAFALALRPGEPQREVPRLDVDVAPARGRAGHAGQLGVRLTNPGDRPYTVRVAVEGPSAAWFGGSSDSVTCPERDTRSVELAFEVPAAPGVEAGACVVVVSDADSGALIRRVEAQVLLEAVSLEAGTRATVVSWEAELQCIPGVERQTVVRVGNIGAHVEHLSVRASGVPDAWVLTPPWAQVNPGAQADITLGIEVPRAPSATAGRRTVTLDVVCRSTGAAVAGATATARWRVEPYAEIQTGLEPQVLRGRAEAVTHLRVTNLGNEPAQVAIKRGERSSDLTYSIDPDRQNVLPGEEAVFRCVVRRDPPWWGRAVKHPLKLDAWVGEANKPVVLEGHFLQRPWLSAWVLAAMVATVAFGVGLGAAWWNWDQLAECTVRDCDGVYGDADLCPNRAEDTDTIRVMDGCPEDDEDHDGVKDRHDKAPFDPEDFDGVQDSDGKPERDADGDGVLDSDDQCKLTKGTPEGCPDRRGCPAEDCDGDLLVGAADKCPHEAEDDDGLCSQDGCPEIDCDEDGVSDTDDDCATVAGNMINGCPGGGPADVDGDGLANRNDSCQNEPGPPCTRGCPDLDHDCVRDAVDDCPTAAGLPAWRGCPPPPAEIVFKAGGEPALELSTTTGGVSAMAEHAQKPAFVWEQVRPGHKLRLRFKLDYDGEYKVMVSTGAGRKFARLGYELDGNKSGTKSDREQAVDGFRDSVVFSRVRLERGTHELYIRALPIRGFSIDRRAAVRSVLIRRLND